MSDAGDAGDGTTLHSSGLVRLAPVAVSGARRAGLRATQHVTDVPVFYVSRGIDMGPALRRAQGLKVTPTEVLVIASARALLAAPAAHACLADGAVNRFTSTRVAVLVRSGDALVPLVFPEAEASTAVALRQDRAELQRLLAENRLPVDRMAAPTLVISNLGTYGVDWFTAVLFPGNAITLAVGRGLTEGESVIFQVVLTCDHRIIDGVDAAEFLSALDAAVQDVVMAG